MMRRLSLLPVPFICLLLLLLLVAHHSSATRVPIGHVSMKTAYFQGWATLDISGWACVPGHGGIIEVQLYFNNELHGTIVTDRTSTSTVDTKCRSSSNHNFFYQIHWHMAREYRNQIIRVFGKHGGSKRELTNSGKIRIPNTPPTDVRGYIAGGPSVWESGYKITGWACQTGDRRSINVDVYIGASAWDNGRFLKRVNANLPSDSYSTDYCETPGFARFGFEIPISSHEYHAHKGQTVYVHGVSTRNTGNAFIHRSGYARIPVESRSSSSSGECIPIYYSARIHIETSTTRSECTESHTDRIVEVLEDQMTDYFSLMGLKYSQAKVCTGGRRRLNVLAGADGNDRDGSDPFPQNSSHEGFSDDLEDIYGDNVDLELLEHHTGIIGEISDGTTYPEPLLEEEEEHNDGHNKSNADDLILKQLNDNNTIGYEAAQAGDSDLDSMGSGHDDGGVDSALEIRSSFDSMDSHRELSTYKFFFGGGRCYLCFTDDNDYRGRRELATLYGLDRNFNSWKTDAERDMAAYMENAVDFYFRRDASHCYHRVQHLDLRVELQQESSWESANKCGP